MNCAAVEPLISDLLDGELSDDARAAVEAHLASCEGCAGEYRRLRRTVRFVQANAARTLHPGTPGAGYNDFMRATMDESMGKTPLEVLVEQASDLYGRKGEER